jgi:type I protein arginine methyltransferase
MHKYALDAYVQMATDASRLAYARALEEVVRPDSIVVDVGTGLGIFALLACRYGARRVYAIEPNEVLHVAREIAKANGCGNRIEFIQAPSIRVQLPERVDIVVSDLRGTLPLFEESLGVIIDARERFLKSDGVLVPWVETLWASAVDAPETYARVTAVEKRSINEFDMSAATRYTTDALHRTNDVPKSSLVEPQRWAVLDYPTLTTSNVSGELRGTVTNEGTGHGVMVWFESLLTATVRFSTGPDVPPTVYGRVFLPWSRPLMLSAGDRLSVAIHANLVGGHYVWQWHTLVTDPEGQRKAEFRQSDFHVAPSLDALQRAASGFAPSLNEDGLIDRAILEMIDGDTALHVIAERLAELFPQRFTDRRNALARVSELSVAYGR